MSKKDYILKLYLKKRNFIGVDYNNMSADFKKWCKGTNGYAKFEIKILCHQLKRELKRLGFEIKNLGKEIINLIKGV